MKLSFVSILLFFFFNDTATTEIYTLSLHDALPIFADRGHLLLEHLAHALARHLAVPDPLPDLRARDLGGGRVFHQPVDARGAAAAEPERDVLEADVDVVA